MGKRRSAIVLVEDGHVALIRRRRPGVEYFLFPGGGVEHGESDEAAAAREAHEELGLEVQIIRLIGYVTHGDVTQLYYEAAAVGGHFGSGTGPELTSPTDSARGSYEPLWLPTAELTRHDVRPWDLARLVADNRLPDSPVALTG